jgi:phenylpropionate dioxygenase-like ring-hydroxylating dioxygenase large terminal subunit
MGRMLRQYWVPALRAARLEADGAPVRVKLFGENFVAFRDTKGQVGFLDEGCPHRGVSLALGRNEECGLRCIFHGWKFDVHGNVLETPSEPQGSTLASKVRVNHYPLKEAGGIIWVWLGQGEQPPQFPAFEFVNLPPEQVVVRAAILKVNWVQSLEGLLDSAHVTSLHKDWLPQGANAMQGAHAGVMGDLAPRYEIDDRPYGFRAKAIRTLDDGRQVNRMTEYVLPFYCFIPNTLASIRTVSMGVPVDDENTVFWGILWDLKEPLDAVTADIKRNAGKLGPDPDNYYTPRGEAGQIWGQDRELMKKGSYAGFQALPFEDFAVQESQGAIADRSKEHLGQSDIAVIRARRLLLDLARDFQQGKTPRGLDQTIEYEKIHAVHEITGPLKEPQVLV